MDNKPTSYTYKCPIKELGMKSLSITRKQHNSIFPTRQHKWFDRYEYFYNDDILLMHRYKNWIFKTILILTYPLSVLYAGLSNIKELNREIYKTIFEQKMGGFVREDMRRNSSYYPKVMAVAKYQK